MNRLAVKWLVFLTVFAVSSAAYAHVGKQLVKSGTRALGSTAGERSILGTMDGWYESGAALKRSVSASTLQKSFKRFVHPQESRDHAFRNGSFFAPITPTPLRELRVNLIHPTTEQVQQAVSEYRNLVKDFAPVHKEITTKLLYKTLPNDKWTALLPQERRSLILSLSRLQGRVEKLRRVVFAKDQPLEKMAVWIDTALQEVNPFYMPGIRLRGRADKRVFDRNEFFLKYPNKADLPAGVTAPERTVPPDLRVAVLNDQEDILDMYRAWDQQGRLGEGWSVTTYKDTRNLLNDLQNGHMYDLIITDLTVPGGGGYFLTDQVREMGLNMPIIGCSMYTLDKLDAQKMFDQGFDGYIYGDDLFEEMSGSVSWLGYIKNYYYYKALHGWSR